MRFLSSIDSSDVGYILCFRVASNAVFHTVIKFLCQYPDSKNLKYNSEDLYWNFFIFVREYFMNRKQQKLSFPRLFYSI